MLGDAYRWIERFDRGQTFSTTPGHNGWTLADTSAAGSPTMVTLDGGGCVTTLASTSEVEIMTLYQNDRLIWDIAQIQSISWWVSLSAMAANSIVAFGLASGRNDTLDSVTANAWFRLEGATPSVLVESDDSATDNDDKATGIVMGSSVRKLTIDFASHGKNDIRFFVDNTPVATSTTFTMYAYTGKVQPLMQLQKATGADVPAITIKAIEAVISRNY